MSRFAHDPDYDRSPDAKLVFVRYTTWPLFSRVDVLIRADFRGERPVGTWSPHESALMNVLGAVKATLRGRGDVDGLLERGFARIGALDPGGTVTYRMEALVTAAVAGDPATRSLADRIRIAVQSVHQQSH